MNSQPPPPTPQRRTIAGPQAQPQSRPKATASTSSQLLKPPTHQQHPSRPPPPPRHIPADRRPGPTAHTNPADPFAPNHPQQPRITIQDLLPYCTTRGVLSEQDITNLAEVAGSLRELVAKALQGGVDSMGGDVLEGAMGAEVGRGVREFWGEEWVVE
ncbi:hypothetical protein BU16DRAFT_604414 [Lophium mytilinum]|uniref:Uncharacterized protein n=1 Tax=Lophium mytilinum TaxID=390894 RepID=A0A6A6R4G0_9PEZI|nr:hypothetical protein BU16DRAFT_604414 [Lophium mytilinum]